MSKKKYLFLALTHILFHFVPFSTSKVIISHPIYLYQDHSTIISHNKWTNDVVFRLQNSWNNVSVRNIVIKRSPAQSHCVRPHNYKLIDNTIQLDMTSINKVIDIEVISKDHREFNCIPTQFLRLPGNPLKVRTYDSSTDCKNDHYAVVNVQAMTSMEDLVDRLLPLGLVPAVVPEFKGITVGGSIQGDTIGL